jgi:hypothetical protein
VILGAAEEAEPGDDGMLEAVVEAPGGEIVGAEVGGEIVEIVVVATDRHVSVISAGGAAAAENVS